MKMEGCMEYEFSVISRVKKVAKNIIFGSTRTYFTHMRVKRKISHRINRIIKKALAIYKNVGKINLKGYVMLLYINDVLNN